MNHVSSDVVVVGAGPAGIAAACTAARTRQVTIIDDNPAPGGQIWRGYGQASGASGGGDWFSRLRGIAAQRLYSSRVVGLGDSPRTLLVERPDGMMQVCYRDLILATGARELFLPFAGWTLPNVMGPGGLQALVKCGLRVEAKRIVVAGSGPLLLAVAAYLRKHGASIVCVVEQAPFSALSRFGKRLVQYPGKIVEAARLQSKVLGVRYLTGTWVEAASGGGRVESVTLVSHQGRRREDCDYLAIAYGLTPNVELPSLLGCEIHGGKVSVNDRQQTSQPHIYCAGEPTGVGGVDLALVEGQIAGAAVAGDRRTVESLSPQRERWQRFAAFLDEGFALRAELRALAKPDTIVCRCEDVSLERLQRFDSWRAAKLHTRCGMGPCQGRVCGAAVHHLLGWDPESVRPPIFPITVAALAAFGNHSSD